MDTDNLPTPFVSDDLVNECLKALKKLWSCTEYEALLIEWEVKANMKDEREATVNIQLRFEAVVKWLTQFEAEAGDNKVWWERWIKEVSGSEDYTKIDFDWYRGHFPLKCSIVVNLFSKMCEAAKADELLSPEEQIFLAKCSPLPEMCREVCKAMGIDEALTKVGQLYVVKHLKALCLYIALQNEQNKLKKEAELYHVSLNDQTRPKPRNQNKRKTVDALTPEVKRIFDAAVEDGRFMKKTHTGYEWIFEDGSPTKLCFFLLEVYKPQSPPWEQLQKLFARTETLKNHASQMRGREWYKEWLEGQRQVGWAKEIRDFVQSVKHTNEAPPVKQQRTTTPTQTPPPVRQMTTEEAFNWMESLRPNPN